MTKTFEQVQNRAPRVLIVDVDTALREIVAKALSSAGWTVRSASDGVDGLVAIHDWRPDVILLDPLDSRMDGKTFRDELARHSYTANIPIVVTSAGERTLIETATLAATVISKPFDLERLVACLTETVESNGVV